MDRFSRAVSQGSGARPRASGQSGERQRFAGVEIRPAQAGCCKAVQRLAGRRFLPDEAPLLPLPGCDLAICSCRYKRLVNRRSEIRRDEDLGLEDLTGISSVPGDRRSPVSGRRATDDEAS